MGKRKKSKSKKKLQQAEEIKLDVTNNKPNKSPLLHVKNDSKEALSLEAEPY